jgi:hypothetical protein
MRAFLAIVLPLVLGACVTEGAPRDPADGNWIIDRRVDRITGEPGPKVYVEAHGIVGRNSRTGTGIVQLMCFRGGPIVRFANDFRVGSNTTGGLVYRFDQKPPHTPKVKFLTDFKTVVIEDKAEVAHFVGDLETSSALLMRITSLAEGDTEYQYRVTGGAHAVEEAFAACPLKRTAAREPVRGMG